ncbi:MAG TPA: hypothetical protein VGR77_03485 [Candidatus Dormibacteraeota bacterium]|nr:hypothetical protein [Candidatus Dormibacteraeota bacterium]
MGDETCAIWSKTLSVFWSKRLMFSRYRCGTLRDVEEILKLWHAAGRRVVESWNHGLDEHDARRQVETRARRIFNAIMTDRCGQCLAPVALCRQPH